MLILPSRKLRRPIFSHSRWQRWKNLLSLPAGFPGIGAGSLWLPQFGLPLLMPELDISACTDCCGGGVTCACIPDTLTATVVATTGNCGALLGSTGVLTKGIEIWTGTMAPTVGPVAMSCGADSIGCESGVMVTLDSQGPCNPTDRTIEACFTCDPFFATFTFTVAAGASVICCTPGGGTYTIEVTE